MRGLLGCLHSTATQEQCCPMSTVGQGLYAYQELPLVPASRGGPCAFYCLQ